ncbi:MAG: type II toxin-antitoxin system RelB/DinJ family antitoxin [Peptococcaceae bacterium]|nr:type II toxin-antitoxin system RelB/DinJ family antitoxin [Peptococcaceae bacterium]MBQ3205063.1 type II toxin-antitoxin system RelB/DinJ family antitoxin [Peptococcaceae bacterium]MBQ6853303.1 type II toxin-antitoxin system RelB/DinJ family antitoxin [Peptococcaceae bacterium]
MATTSMNIRMDTEVKRKAQMIFAELGMDTTTAVNLFLRQVIRTQSIPFELKAELPNEETMEAIEEVRMMKQNPSMGKRYQDVDTMMEDLLRDEI